MGGPAPRTGVLVRSDERHQDTRGLPGMWEAEVGVMCLPAKEDQGLPATPEPGGQKGPSPGPVREA